MNHDEPDRHFEELTFPNYFLLQIINKIFVLLIIEAYFPYTASHKNLWLFEKKNPNQREKEGFSFV